VELSDAPGASGDALAGGQAGPDERTVMGFD